jgi:hypothetical protein
MNIKSGQAMFLALALATCSTYADVNTESYPHVTIGTAVEGHCREGATMVSMGFRQDQAPSPLINYFVEPKATVRCLPNFGTEAPKIGQTLNLARDENGVFGIVSVASYFWRTPSPHAHSPVGTLDVMCRR